MDPALATVIGTAITGLTGIIGASIAAWVTVQKGEDRAEVRRLRRQVTRLGGDPDEDE